MYLLVPRYLQIQRRGNRPVQTLPVLYFRAHLGHDNRCFYGIRHQSLLQTGQRISLNLQSWSRLQRHSRSGSRLHEHPRPRHSHRSDRLRRHLLPRLLRSRPLSSGYVVQLAPFSGHRRVWTHQRQRGWYC